MERKKFLIFASGDESGGASGARNLLEALANGDIQNAECVGIVSQHDDGGARRVAKDFGVKFYGRDKDMDVSDPWSEDLYRRIVEESGAEWFLLSGWTKFTHGLDPRRTINIHPAPLPKYGGKGWFGAAVHRKMMWLYWTKWRVKFSGVSMHFVTDEYDKGPIIFLKRLRIRPWFWPKLLGRRVNRMEHKWQPYVTNLVLNEMISWDGEDPESLRIPSWYTHLDQAA